MTMAFSSRPSVLEEDFNESIIVCAFFPFFNSFFYAEIGSCTPIPGFKPGSVHSGSAS